MSLISNLVKYDEKSAQCNVVINQDSLFFSADLAGVPSYVGIEYMAQSIAAFSGANGLDVGEPVKIGFLLGSRKYQSYTECFALGETYIIDVVEFYKDESGLSVFECQIKHGDELIAEAKVNVFQPESA